MLKFESFRKVNEMVKKVNEKVKKMKAFLQSEFVRRAPVKARKEGMTHLHYAALLGHVVATKALLENGAEVNAVDEDNDTALHLAAWKGHVDVVKVLIQKGADVNAVQKDNLQHFTSQLGKDMLTLRKC